MAEKVPLPHADKFDSSLSSTEITTSPHNLHQHMEIVRETRNSYCGSRSPHGEFRTNSQATRYLG